MFRTFWPGLVVLAITASVPIAGIYTYRQDFPEEVSSRLAVELHLPENARVDSSRRILAFGYLTVSHQVYEMEGVIRDRVVMGGTPRHPGLCMYSDRPASPDLSNSYRALFR